MSFDDVAERQAGEQMLLERPRSGRGSQRRNSSPPARAPSSSRAAALRGSERARCGRTLNGNARRFVTALKIG
jgi:hypothetical protein